MTAPSVVIASEWLQWGHALGGVETAGSPTSAAPCERLQWGHALGGVETTPAAVVVIIATARFNGATPWEAWKPFGSASSTRAGQTALQWGHALGGVETVAALREGFPQGRLQWGHALGGVETQE